MIFSVSVTSKRYKSQDEYKYQMLLVMLQTNRTSRKARCGLLLARIIVYPWCIKNTTVGVEEREPWIRTGSISESPSLHIDAACVVGLRHV